MDLNSDKKIQKLDAQCWMCRYNDLLNVISEEIPRNMHDQSELFEKPNKIYIKNIYMEGYKLYLECCKIQEKWADFFVTSSLQRLHKAKEILDSEYRKSIKELRLREASNGR